MREATTPTGVPPGRLVSLDAYRGLTMFLLIAEGAGIYHALLAAAPEGSVWQVLFTQFTHHPWNGLRFWDLIQPFFMFIVGVAMPFAFARRWERGDSWSEAFRHVLLRSFVLLWLGVMLHCGYAGRPVFELWNVLTQLSFTYLVAFLMMRRPAAVQIGFTFGLLILVEAAYRLFWVPGFDQPFIKDHNFGSYMDLVLMGKLNNGGGWVAINCIPTTAHTMWGVLCGWLLKSDRPSLQKVKILLLAGLAGVVAGYALDPVTPIIKRICTSSFVIVSGGYCLLTLALFYWIVDVRKIWKWSQFAIIIGTNSIFIYLFASTVGPQWFNDFVGIFTLGLFQWAGDAPAAILTALIVLGLEWALCYWLFKRRIFFKI